MSYTYITLPQLLSLWNRLYGAPSVDEEKAIRGAFSSRGKTKGFLKMKRPQGPAGAVWTALQSNSYKISIGYLMFLHGEEKAMYEKLEPLNVVAKDWDRAQLEKLGVW